MKMTLSSERRVMRDADLNPEDILTNNVILPGEYNPHSVRLWVIGNEFGPLCAVWADCEQDALDEAFDAGKLDSFAIEPEGDDHRQGLSYLGNASEPCDLTYAYIFPVAFDPTRDLSLIIKLAEARGAQADHLD